MDRVAHEGGVGSNDGEWESMFVEVEIVYFIDKVHAEEEGSISVMTPELLV